MKPDVLAVASREALYDQQHTLAVSIECTGVGIHSGQAATLRLMPAAPNTGVRVRLVDGTTAPFHIDYVVERRLCSMLEFRDQQVMTVEHLLAALAGVGVDNVLIELDGPEAPVHDGSALPWVELLDQAGLCAQPAPRQVLRVLKPVTVGTSAGPWARLEPAVGFSASVTIDFPHPAIGRQSFDWVFDFGSFRRDISPARTFGFRRDMDRLHGARLALGACHENTLVLSDGWADGWADGLSEGSTGVESGAQPASLTGMTGQGLVENAGGLRFETEFVRHKLLDAIGDLFLAGYRIEGRFVASCAGHATHHQLLRALLARPDAWCLVNADDTSNQDNAHQTNVNAMAVLAG